MLIYMYMYYIYIANFRIPQIHECPPQFCLLDIMSPHGTSEKKTSTNLSNRWHGLKSSLPIYRNYQNMWNIGFTNIEDRQWGGLPFFCTHGRLPWRDFLTHLRLLNSLMVLHTPLGINPQWPNDSNRFKYTMTELHSHRIHVCHIW